MRLNKFNLREFVCHWQKISRKDACKGVSESALPMSGGGVIE